MSRNRPSDVPPGAISRRRFVASGSALAAGAMVVPSHVLGRSVGRRPPSDRLNIAIVGAGGMGTENAQELLAENLVAVCDVDFAQAEKKVEERTTEDGEPREKGLAWKEAFQKARRWADYREMLAGQEDLDALVIATPDHTHAAIARAAMEAGKHVYVQKPLAWSIQETRMLREVAARTGAVTQMGNQGHSSDEARRINEWVRSGVLGPVREVHVWTNRPIWPQGLPAPAMPDAMPGSDNWWPGSVGSRVAAMLAMERTAPPSTLHWDLFRGPIAEEIPYHPVYHPFHWRGWTAFGVGALGDMGAHLVDHPFWALELGYPETVQATSTPWGGPRETPATYPLAMTVHYDFPARGARPPVRMSWYDGGLMPARPSHLPDEVELDRTGGVVFVGERGILMHETYGRNPTIWPESLRAEAEEVPESSPRIEESHEMNWVLACRGEAEATCPFDYAAPLTEVMLLGIVALRAGQGDKIEYDGVEGVVTSHADANEYLSRAYRPGWGM